MVEQVRISPEEVRGYGNICEEHSLDDFIVSSSGLAKEKENIHGALTEVYKLVYSLYGLIFSFDKGNKQLYLHSDNDVVVGFSFSEKNLMFNTVSHISFAFAEKNLVVDDENYLFIDKGTSASHNDNWDTWGSYSVTRTRSVDSTLIEPVDRTTASFQIKYINNMSSPSIIEFDCCQVGGATNSIIFQLRGNNQSVIRQLSLSSYTNLSLGEWYHWKVDLVNGNFTNETTNQTLTFSTGSKISFFFVIQANAEHNLKYKNFVIY